MKIHEHVGDYFRVLLLWNQEAFFEVFVHLILELRVENEGVRHEVNGGNYEFIDKNQPHLQFINQNNAFILVKFIQFITVFAQKPLSHHRCSKEFHKFIDAFYFLFKSSQFLADIFEEIVEELTLLFQIFRSEVREKYELFVIKKIFINLYNFTL